MSKQQRAAQTVRLWNLNHAIGTKVVLDPQADAKHTHTTSTAWVLCGEPVISVAGECGSVALGRVVVAEEYKEKKLKHTKEPWQIIGDVNWRVLGPEGLRKFVANCERGESEEGEANARRIVACVNACAGIADPSAIPVMVAAAIAVVEETSVLWIEGKVKHLKEAIAKLKGSK